jgi:PTH1 family peptidyl-tRNA hydrolase
MKVIIGLANPGTNYAQTRHNAGAWFVEAICRSVGLTLASKTKFYGNFAQAKLVDHDIKLLVPSTFMNHSGKAVRAIANFYDLKPEDLLIAHDELDLPPGEIRLKTGGGHGGHNGLRDTIEQLNSNAFARLRIGIGHPGHKNKVVNYVLKSPQPDELLLIEAAIDRALMTLPLMASGHLQQAMKQLHTKVT